MSESSTLVSNGMRCPACWAGTAQVLGRMPGVQAVHIQLMRKVVVVHHDAGQVGREQLAAVLEEHGYRAGDSRPMLLPRLSFRSLPAAVIAALALTVSGSVLLALAIGALVTGEIAGSQAPPWAALGCLIGWVGVLVLLYLMVFPVGHGDGGTDDDGGGERGPSPSPPEPSALVR